MSMIKTGSSETKRLREAEQKKKEKERADRLKYYHENKESINAKRREKRAKARQLKAATENIEDSKTKKYDWALYKPRQRARAKEQTLEKKDKSHKVKPTSNQKGRASSNTVTFPSRMSKKRHIDVVKSRLPQSPAKRVAVVAALIESPTTRKGLESKGLVCSAEKCDEAEVAVSAMCDARDAISATKGQRSTDSRAATQTALGFLCGDKVNNKRMKNKVSKMLNINRKRVGRAYSHRKKVLTSKKSCWTYTERKTRSDAIPTEHRKLAYEFWASPDVSRTTPNKRDIVRKRLAPKTYVTHPKQILEKTQTEAYMEFKQKYPEIQMGQRTFESCKPFYIATPRPQDRISCCCRIHVETRMVFQSCMEFRQQLGQIPEQFNVYKHLSDLVSETLCPKQEGKEYHEPKCLSRKCENCGIDGFKTTEIENDCTETAPMVNWRKFEYVVMDNNSDKKKLKLVDKSTPVGEMFSCLKNLLQTYPSHQFRAKWQNQQLRELVQNLPIGHVVAVHDYSENYTCAMQDQIQSLYFSQVQASIHVTILHRHALMDVDGVLSTEENPVVITEHLFVISADCKHDHHSVHSARKRMDGYLKEIGKEKNHLLISINESVLLTYILSISMRTFTASFPVKLK